MMEALYEVVSPEGHVAVSRLSSTPAVRALNTAVIGELWDWRFRGDAMFPLIERELRRRFPRIRFVGYGAFGNIHGPHEVAVLGRLRELLQQHGCMGVIAGVGA